MAKLAKIFLYRLSSFSLWRLMFCYSVISSLPCSAIRRAKNGSFRSESATWPPRNYGLINASLRFLPPLADMNHTFMAKSARRVHERSSNAGFLDMSHTFKAKSARRVLCQGGQDHRSAGSAEAAQFPPQCLAPVPACLCPIGSGRREEGLPTSLPHRPAAIAARGISRRWCRCSFSDTT